MPVIQCGRGRHTGSRSSKSQDRSDRVSSSRTSPNSALLLAARVPNAAPKEMCSTFFWLYPSKITWPRNRYRVDVVQSRRSSHGTSESDPVGTSNEKKPFHPSLGCLCNLVYRNKSFEARFERFIMGHSEAPNSNFTEPLHDVHNFSLRDLRDLTFKNIYLKDRRSRLPFAKEVEQNPCRPLLVQRSKRSWHLSTFAAHQHPYS